MTICFRCERDGKEVKLNDAIYENDFVKVCERCAITENIPVLKKPSTSQLKAAEKSYGVNERMRRMARYNEKERQHKSILDEIKKLDENPELEKPEEKPFNLIDNFHWHVMRARRNRGLSQKQLSWAIGESETALRIVERGELPGEPENLIKKLEQFFQIRLRERTELELEQERRKREIKLNVPRSEIASDPIQAILEEEIEEEDLIPKGKKENLKEENASSPTKILKFEPKVMDNITIADLRKIKKEKEQAESLEIKEGEGTKDREIKIRIAEEMKDSAMNEEKDSIYEKRNMLNSAMRRVSQAENRKKDSTPSIYELFEKKKDKEKLKIEEEKVEIKKLEKKSEQDQIKQVLMRDKESKKEDLTGPRKEVPTITELAGKKVEEDKSVLGEDIELIEDEDF
jgi:ribosome-binding protein aMBF1 (putative translation factor)